MSSTFEDYALDPAVQQGLARLGLKQPTPVQAHAIPLVLDGRDAIVQAKTGSGKTYAFGLPVLSLLDRGKRPQALVIVPTRELAVQVCDALEAVCPNSPLRLVSIYGGVGYGPQETALASGVDVIVGCPGRLKDLHARGTLDLTGVRILVLDEADKMLDMGFRRDIEFLLNRLPAREQTLILSATMPKDIEAIARSHMREPVVVKLDVSEVSPSEIEHFHLKLGRDQRVDALVQLLLAEKPERAIVFTRTKHETKRLAQKLEKLGGLAAGYLNGNMSQNARNTMMARFRAGEIGVLVATDVAARGLDVEGLTHVFHFAVPTVVETYIHRSGRTGRAGNEGKTIIFVTPDEEPDFKAILKQIHCNPFPLDLETLPAREATLDTAPTPRQPREQSRQPREQSRQPRERTARVAAAPAAEEVSIPGLERSPARGAAMPGQRRGGNAAPKQAVRQSAEPAPQGEGRRRRGLSPQVTNPSHDASALLADAPRERVSTGPLAPLPRHVTSWRKFRLALQPGHKQTRDSLHTWLSRSTGVARSSLRSIAIYADHATVEVEGRDSERFLEGLKGKSVT